MAKGYDDPALARSVAAELHPDSGHHDMRVIFRLMYMGIAATALLVGIQAPNFVDQYEKRVDAHLSEVRANLAPFQEIADRYHGGSLEALIARHEQSEDATFHAEGSAIRKLQERYIRFRDEQGHLQADLVRQLVWIVANGDRELLDETRTQYSFALLLDSTAVLAGASFTLLVVLVMELLAGLIRLLRPARPHGA